MKRFACLAAGFIFAYAALAGGAAKVSSGIKAYSMLTHDGRRLVSHVEGTNTVFELVATNALPANLPPVREWTLYAVKSAHTDIGLHNSQYIQRHGTVRRIDEARRLIAADPDDSDPGAFRYVAEGAWFWGNYPQERGEAAAMSVATNEIARGRLDVDVTCAGNHTHLYGFEELCRSIYTKRELEDRWGIKTRTMLMTDNPGISWSIVAPYAEAGVEHVLFSPNHWNPHPSTIWKMDVNRPWSRNNPDAGGGGSRIDVRWDSAIPMLFWWQAPQSAARLLVWTCPHYGRGGEPFGIITAWNKMKPMSESEPMMARQLAKMEARYPYDVWLFADYEDDEWPSTRQADLFKKWNAKWKWPQLRTCGRLDEPFDRVKARWGDKIPTLRGEMTSGWLQHAACTPALLARKMAADRALARAETLTAVKAARDKVAYPAEDLRRAWDALIWNDEHSYGVSGYSGRRVFETWMQHRDWIERAERVALDLIQRAIPGMIIHKGNPSVLICHDGLTENRWYRVAVTNGVVYSIYDKELVRELLEGPANEFRYTRDNHKTWMRGDEAERALGAEVEQKVWLSQDEKKIVLESSFRHARDLFNTNRYDRFGYMAFPFAVPQFRFAAQLNGPVIDPVRDQSGLTSDAFTAVRDWCAVENGEFGVALVMADSCLTEFGEIHPDKTCYGGPVKSSGIYPYLFTDWLQMHNPDGDSFNFSFRYAITSYAGTWQNAHIPAFAERALDDLDEKYYGSSMPLSRYDLSVDSPAWNVQLLTLKRAEDGRGLIARFREREGRPCRVTASQHLAPDAEYTLCNVIERDVRKLDGFEFDLAPFGYATIRIDAPSLRFATKSPDDSAYAYTGLITAPRAGHGGKDGQMYVLWGAEMSPDFDHYELWRDGKFLANVTNEAPDGVAYRVARYEDLVLPTHSRHEYRIRKVWKDGRKDPLGEPFWGLTRAMANKAVSAPVPVTYIMVCCHGADKGTAFLANGKWDTRHDYRDYFFARDMMRKIKESGINVVGIDFTNPSQWDQFRAHHWPMLENVAKAAAELDMQYFIFMGNTHAHTMKYWNDKAKIVWETFAQDRHYRRYGFGDDRPMLTIFLPGKGFKSHFDRTPESEKCWLAKFRIGTCQVNDPIVPTPTDGWGYRNMSAGSTDLARFAAPNSGVGPKEWARVDANEWRRRVKWCLGAKEYAVVGTYDDTCDCIFWGIADVRKSRNKIHVHASTKDDPYIYYNIVKAEIEAMRAKSASPGEM